MTSASAAPPTGSCGWWTARSSAKNFWRCRDDRARDNRRDRSLPHERRPGRRRLPSVCRACPARPGWLRGRLRARLARGQGARVDVLARRRDCGGRLGRRPQLLRGADREVRNHLPVASRPRDVRGRACRRTGGRTGLGSAVSKIFGISVDRLTAVLAVLLVLALTAIAAMALRNRVFLRLGVRGVLRRGGRTALIVLGLMLGTTIISAALATGDTMSHTIRSSATRALGQTDEVVGAKGIDAALASPNGGSTGWRYFRQHLAERLAHDTHASGLIKGVEPVIVEPVAVQDATSHQTEPRVTLFATRPDRLLGTIRAGGRIVSLGALGPGEAYLNAKGAEKLVARPGDILQVLSGNAVSTMRVKALVRYDGGGTDGAGVLMPLGAAQQFLGRQGLVKALFVANAGGVSATGAAMKVLQPAAAGLGLEADNTKHDALQQADAGGAAFMSFFTTFGSFSIAAGILLIFLIFVKIAAESRSELGIARAVGTRRRHLVQMFLYEGAAYDLAAAAVGALTS